MHNLTISVQSTAAKGIEALRVLQAHLAYLSDRERKNLENDLRNRGIDLEAVVSALGSVARNEDPRRVVKP